MIRKLSDLTDLEKLALIDISYSRLDTYAMCSARYFYTYIQKEERQFGPAAALGNIIHGVLEDTVGERLDLDHMLTRMSVHREHYDPEHQISENLIEVGEKLIYEFIDNHGDEIFDVIGKELSFELVIGSALVRGYIDLVTQERELIRITDYKTGRHEVTYKAIPDNLQIGIYALAAAQLYPDQTIRAELYYLRSGRRKGHTFTPSDLERVEQRVLDQVNEIINKNNFLPTSNPQPCNFCDFAKSGLCKTGLKRLRDRQWR